MLPVVGSLLLLIVVVVVVLVILLVAVVLLTVIVLLLGRIVLAVKLMFILEGGWTLQLRITLNPIFFLLLFLLEI